MSDLTLIIPAKNEKESLPKVLDELGDFGFKINVLLESSDKLTIESIKNYNCNISDIYFGYFVAWKFNRLG